MMSIISPIDSIVGTDVMYEFMRWSNTGTLSEYVRRLRGDCMRVDEAGWEVGYCLEKDGYIDIEDEVGGIITAGNSIAFPNGYDPDADYFWGHSFFPSNTVGLRKGLGVFEVTNMVKQPLVSK